MNRRRQKTQLIPLVNVLKSLKASDRVIILAHLDDVTRDDLCVTVNSVLKSEKVPIETRLKLQQKLRGHSDCLKHIASDTASPNTKRKKLTQLGGGPMKLILQAALPMMLNLFPN